MHLIARRSAEDLLAALAAGRDLRTGSAPWTLKFIERATGQFGQWREVEIDGATALAIILPPHNGEPCKGDRLALVPGGGATVAEAARSLGAIRVEYERNNPTCWGRIAEASDQAFSTIILTSAPLDADEYRSIAPAAGRLYHLDGFHRLVGWALAGRITPDVRLRAFVAVGSDPQP
ncbi:MAG: DUF6309 family protein [Vicinamibacterales bacterium]